MALGFALVPFAGRCAEVDLTARVTSRLEYNDNLAFRADKQGGWRLNVSPSLELQRNVVTSRLAADLNVGLNAVSSDVASNATTGGGSLSWSQKFDRSQFDAKASYRRETIPQRIVAQSGINLGNRSLDRWDVVPTWTFILSDRLSANAGAGFSQARYAASRQAGKSTETSKSVSAGLSYALTDRANVGTSLSYSTFDSDPFVSESESTAFNLNGRYLLSPVHTLSISGGVQRIRSTQAIDVTVCPVDPVFCQLGVIQPVIVAVRGTTRNTAYPMSVSFQHLLSEVDSYSLSFNQQVNASGLGAATGSTAFNAGYRRELSPTVSMSVGAGLTLARALDGRRLGNFVEASAAVDWKLDEDWGASFGYQYSRSGYRDADSVQANALYATVNYRWPLMNASR